MPRIHAALACIIVPLLASAAGPASMRIERLPFSAGQSAAQPSVAVDPRSGFVLTWQERDAAGASLWFALLDWNGREQRRGRIAAGSKWFVNWADFPSLAVLDNGDWVAHWMQKSAATPYAYDLRIVRSANRGQSWSAALVPHSDRTLTQHGFVALTPLGGDRVLAVWLDGRRGAQASSDEDGPMTLRSAIVDRAGRLHEERELDDSVCSCCQTAAVRWVGRTLVAYRDRSSDEIRDIGVVARSADGAWSKPRVLNKDGWRIEACPVNGPALAVSNARLLAVWPTGASGALEVRYTVREWDKMSATHSLDAGPGVVAGRVDAAAWGSGFLASWIGSDGDATALRLARIGPDGVVAARLTVADASPSRWSGNPRLASRGERALLAWVEPGATRELSGIALALIKP